MSRFINPVPQYFLNDGSMASSGRLKFFVNKDYSTLKDTFSGDEDGSPANTNPLVLDGSGRLPPCFGEGLYSVKFYAYDPQQPDGLGELQWTRDDVSLSELSGQFDSWSPIESYSIGDKVKASSGDYYESLQNGNKGNNPLSSPSYWSKVIFITTYNQNTTYPANYIVEYLGRLYRSIAGGNLNHTPPSTEWENLTFNNSVTGNFNVTGTITALNTTKTAVKNNSTQRNNTTVASNDPDLVIAGLAVDSWYKVSALLSWSGTGSATYGIKVNISLVDASPGQIFYIDSTSSGSNSAPTANHFDSLLSGFNKLPNVSSVREPLLIEAMIKTNASGSPSLAIEWAQSVSGANFTNVHAGSFLTAIKL
jgi:flagellar hook assembly protein FlgD